MKGKIELKGLEFHAFHGCLEEEKKNGNRFIVDVSFICDITTAALEDELSGTVDYSVVYALVAKEMAIPSNLLENVAYRIRNAILEKFPQMEGLTVSVSKCNPPVEGVAAYSMVTI